MWAGGDDCGEAESGPEQQRTVALEAGVMSLTSQPTALSLVTFLLETDSAVFHSDDLPDRVASR